MATFTFIMEYRGGTYISQVSAASIDLAIVQWARNLNTSEIAHFGFRLKKRLLEALGNENDEHYSAVELKGLKNVWCVGMPLSGMLVNAVKTDLG